MIPHVVMWPVDDWPEAAAAWRRAEELGFDTAWVYDHLAWGGHTPVGRRLRHPGRGSPRRPRRSGSARS
ncbi:hypothetical protein [Nocardioides sp. TF02-7]|uniref:hypothetical protein n=1 Tax=Nocardioides sp. TF02-7 TaxID=2917724 RepID=UPI001F05BB0B|nr:hypothetical protein [Nocardioides sp. TF02-7]UMG92573.1 hypothetical protein MF408_22665 [Nocardioides sp. TF02-7]